MCYFYFVKWNLSTLRVNISTMAKYVVIEYNSNEIGKNQQNPLSNCWEKWWLIFHNLMKKMLFFNYEIVKIIKNYDICFDNFVHWISHWIDIGICWFSPFPLHPYWIITCLKIIEKLTLNVDGLHNWKWTIFVYLTNIFMKNSTFFMKMWNINHPISQQFDNGFCCFFPISLELYSIMTYFAIVEIFTLSVDKIPFTK